MNELKQVGYLIFVDRVSDPVIGSLSFGPIELPRVIRREFHGIFDEFEAKIATLKQDPSVIRAIVARVPVRLFVLRGDVSCDG